MNKKRKILVFTGAGVSAESGISTFRSGDDSLWNNYKVEDVASIEGWNRNRKLVLDFYNDRRKELLNTEPNESHKVIKQLESCFDVTVVTQNIDSLHEKAGSTNILHLHGELLKKKSLTDGSISDYLEDIKVGDGYRPYVTWFGEALDSDITDKAKEVASDVDVCIIVGTSMKVWPANILPFLTKHTCLIYYLDPSDINFDIPTSRKPYFYHFKENSSTGMKKVMDDILETFYL